MKRVTRGLEIVTMLTLFTVLTFGTASAGAIEGTIQGLQCVVSGKICPIDNQDPHVAAEKNFVVHNEGKGYHFVTNIDRAILARYLNKKVRVSGKASSKYNTLTADKFEVFIKGKWHTKWTLEEELQQRRLAGAG